MTSFQPGLLGPILEHIPPQKHPCTTSGKRQTSSSRRFCPGGKTSGAQGSRVRGGNSPEDGSLDLDLESIRSARTEILAAAYSFTSKPIAEALLTATPKGLAVRVVADAKNIGDHFSAVTYRVY
jgi:phosphatidylserine/phosphatidylglycerophosphate/cardiolipin synthase-like enzyme